MSESAKDGSQSERENEGNVCERNGDAARELGREEVSHRAGPYGGKGAGGGEDRGSEPGKEGSRMAGRRGEK